VQDEDLWPKGLHSNSQDEKNVPRVAVAEDCVAASGCLHVCYTFHTVIRGFFGTLLLALGLWGSFHAFLVKGTSASCQSACTCGCCMHGGMCHMMAKGAGMRMAPESGHISAASQTRPSVACSCSVSQPVTLLMSVSHAEMLFNLPQARIFSLLPSSINLGGANLLFRPAPDGRLPDPPPKAFSSV
jgi:hypothetical protein